MAPLKCRMMIVVVLVAMSVPALDAQGQMTNLDATALEMAQLPRFCLGQMGLPGAKGPEYELPRNCGSGMNHYCPGLVYLIRAKNPALIKYRAQNFGMAKAGTGFMENALKSYPACPIRDHIEATRAEIQRLSIQYGTGRPGKK